MNYTITEYYNDEIIINKLIELSISWEIENISNGYIRNTKEDLWNREIYVLSNDLKIIGYLFGYINITTKDTSIMPANTKCFEVEELFIVQEERSKGYGKILFSYALDELKKQVNYITLSTSTKNYKKILHFYVDELDMEFWTARFYKKIN